MRIKMGKFKQKLKLNVKDEVAAFAILGAMIITFAITIGIYTYINHTQVIETGSKIEQTEESNVQGNFDTLKNVTSQEDLKKLEDKSKKDKSEKKDEKESESSSHNYYIKVNYGAQVVTIYTKDSKGEYTVPVKAMVCSTGTHTPTSGIYTIGYRWEWLEMIGSVYGHFVTQIDGDILFHSVPYLEKGNHSSLEWWAYDQLGTKASLGCVRLTTKDALWIYNNISYGTKVEFYSSSYPGPLGKPSSRKISDAPSYVKGWDPTDPDKNNPWPEYLKKLEDEKDKPDKPNKPDKPDDDDKEENNQGNNTIDCNETTNEMTNEENNETANETTNDMMNETTNETINDTTNDTVNETVNETTNDMTNDKSET